MRVLSDPTLGLVVEIAADYFSDSDLKTLLMRADLWQYGEGKGRGNKQELVRSSLLAARDHAEEYGDTDDVRRALLTFIRMIVERTVRNPADTWPWFPELREALLADGYELTWDVKETDPWGPAPASNFRIRPTDAGPVPLSTEISALEAELRSRSYNQALNHYQQATEAFDRHHYEAANSQLRTALEDLVTRLAEDHAGYQRPAKANTGTDAIRHLIQHGHIPERDGGNMLSGLWQMIQTNGPHPGQTDADEARWRMQMVTATARFLLRHFSPQP
jgi:hypothetical protein